VLELKSSPACPYLLLPSGLNLVCVHIIFYIHCWLKLWQNSIFQQILSKSVGKRVEKYKIMQGKVRDTLSAIYRQHRQNQTQREVHRQRGQQQLVKGEWFIAIVADAWRFIDSCKPIPQLTVSAERKQGAETAEWGQISCGYFIKVVSGVTQREWGGGGRNWRGETVADHKLGACVWVQRDRRQESLGKEGDPLVSEISVSRFILYKSQVRWVSCLS